MLDNFVHPALTPVIGAPLGLRSLIISIHSSMGRADKLGMYASTWFGGKRSGAQLYNRSYHSMAMT
jgi:hypothetical protein